MGDQNVADDLTPQALRQFTRHLIQDVRALEYMLKNERFETGVRRVGTEQELFLVDERGDPAPVIEEVLARSDDPRIVSELTRFNLELNFEPMEFGGDVLRRMEATMSETLESVRELVGTLDAQVVMAGILPTVHLSDLTLENMTPRSRYYALNDAISRLRGGPGSRLSTRSALTRRRSR